MNGNKLSVSDYQIFLLKTLLWLALAWGGLIAALAGFFYGPALWVGFALLGAIVFRQMVKHQMIRRPSKEMWVIFILAITIAFIFTFFSTPTVFSGRDQGSFSQAAIRLSQNHSFFFSTPASEEFFKLHESGRALNFPGFYYTSSGQLVTQFPLAYIAWLALFFSIFGITGFAIANGVLFFIFLVSFYLLVRLFLDVWQALPTMIFVTSSFVFMWFTKFTLSENMALPLLWLSILALMLFLKNQRRLFYIIFLLSSFLLAFTRIEGFAFLFVAFVVTFSTTDTRNYLKRKAFERIILPIIIFTGLFVANFLVDINFYRELVKALLPSIQLPQAQYLGNFKHDIPDFYLERIFYLYGMIGFFLLGFLSLIINTFKKEYYNLVPFFITLPTFIYFFDSHITPDHPWMLRRFMFSLLPVAIFYSGLLIGQWLEKNSSPRAAQLKIASYVIIGLLLMENFPTFSTYLSYSENQTLLDQTKTLSQNFSSNDLVLIDQKTTSDGWTMISDPMNSLYGKNAVYFFNIADLTKLDLGKFDKIYLIAPNEQVPYYLNSTIGKRLKFENDYSFTFSKLNMNQNDPMELIRLPKKKNLVVQGKIFQLAK